MSLAFSGVPLPTFITVRPDRTYELEISSPSDEWLLKQAAGIGRSKSEKGHQWHSQCVEIFYNILDEIVGWLSVKHIYEIAKVKSQDRFLVGVPLKALFSI
jgi:large subunit ribosomal protein L11